MERTQPRKYEEYAYVLDFVPRGKSVTVRGRDGIIVTALGEDRLTQLDRKSTRLNSSHIQKSRMPSSA